MTSDGIGITIARSGRSIEKCFPNPVLHVTREYEDEGQNHYFDALGGALGESAPLNRA